KNLIKNLSLFVALAFVFSSLTGCPASRMENGSTTANSANTAETKKKDDSTYPPVPSAIAQADIKMLDGNTFKLEDKRGKVVLFNLWGIWCGPCVAEMPGLIQLQEKFKAKNFELVGLNVGDG